MKLQIENNQNKIKIDKRRIRSTVLRILRILNCADKEISLSFVDDEKIKKLNKQYLGKSKPTNIISFPLQEGEYSNINPDIMGDIVISTETAQRDALRGNLTLPQEIDFLIIHGILHLLGYNHENTTRKEINKMRQKENDLFKALYGTDACLI
ncbi:MAG: rRNA maturation RNase YbeY [Deltaproteobacteria bacterium HGW-Deltaproteobacteria-2]|jgi:probable rRNA maturation factor|nr:MAG: rRNA maturation RNase YbeY [Deltaproteobacteria bacterium HGW-Deltaproteobacteria-2]